MRKTTRRITTFLWLAVACLFFITAILEPTSALSRKPKRSSATGKSKKKKKAARAASKKPKPSPNFKTLGLLADSALGPGLEYSKYEWGTGGPIVHVLKHDLRKDENRLVIVKAWEHHQAKDYIDNAIRRRDSLTRENSLAAINANFWKAGSNLPIGPCVVGGEPVSMTQYKQWSSAFFDGHGQMYIDRFDMSGGLSFNDTTVPVTNLNKRTDSLGMVIYNQFGGPTVPPNPYVDVPGTPIGEVDSTSFAEDTDATDSIGVIVAPANRFIERTANLEQETWKAQLRYLRSPMINRAVPCQLTSLTKGLVKVPLRGAVVSFGMDYPTDNLPNEGDTVWVRFSTNKHDSTLFVGAVSGTPRLVRQGMVRVEAAEEGVTSQRFIRRELPRTAIGTDAQGLINYYVVVEARPDGDPGCSLSEFGGIMKRLGAFQALNLDGGGSSQMLVGSDIVSRTGRPGRPRRLSTFLAITQRKKQSQNR